MEGICWQCYCGASGYSTAIDNGDEASNPAAARRSMGRFSALSSEAEFEKMCTEGTASDDVQRLGLLAWRSGRAAGASIVFLISVAPYEDEWDELGLAQLVGTSSSEEGAG